MEKIIKKLKSSEYLKYTFTPAERTDNARMLARKTQALSELELRKKRLAADIKAEQETAEAEVQRLARFVNDEYDYRIIDCEFTLHTPRTGLKTLVRLDTGEIVKEVAMTTDEMQQQLPFEEQVEGPPAEGPEEPIEIDEDKLHAAVTENPVENKHLRFGPRAVGPAPNP